MTKKKAESAAATEEVTDGEDEPSATSSPSSAEYSVAFSPRQVAVGFAIVAGLVAIALRRHRGRKSPQDD
jgi:hypothetical protein